MAGCRGPKTETESKSCQEACCWLIAAAIAFEWQDQLSKGYSFNLDAGGVLFNLDRAPKGFNSHET